MSRLGKQKSYLFIREIKIKKIFSKKKIIVIFIKKTHYRIYVFLIKFLL